MTEPRPAPSGLLSTLRVALGAGALVGALAGVFDGMVRTIGIDPGLFLLRWRQQGFWTALTIGAPEWSDLPGLLGCTSAAVFLYVIWASFASLVLGFATHLGIRRLAPHLRVTIQSGLVFGAWIFLEVYWWTRSEIYPGLSASHPKRLLAAGVLLALSIAAGFLVPRLRSRVPARVSRATPVCILAIWLVGGVYLLSDTGMAASRGKPNERTENRPNVLLFIVDALRQDVLGCYGHPDVKTPTMDQLADEGVRFANAFVQAPFTWTSFGSFLTGKYPRRHGLVKMEAGYSLPPNVTLPHYLQGAPLFGDDELEEGDYVGAAFLTGTLSHGSGLTRGFDYYFEALVGHELVDVHSRWSAFSSGLLPWLYKNKISQKVDDELVATTAVQWFERNADKRWIAMVHYYSTHTPYDPPRSYRDKYCDPQYDGPITFFDSVYHRIPIERGEYVLTDADRRQIRDLYWAGVTQADTMIRRVLRELERQETLENTIVVVTSDHGESLGEHGLWEHNNMYQDNLRIPLILRWPRGLPQGRVVEREVDSIDLVPTLLELLQVDPLPAAGELAADASLEDRIEAIDGVSLIPWIRGRRDEPVRPYSFAENGRFLSIQEGRWKLIVRREQLEEGGWKRMMRATAEQWGEPEFERPRFFDLRADPHELDNLFVTAYDVHSEPIELLARDLKTWSDSMPIRDDLVRKSHRDREAELLHSLGYGGGVGEGVDDDEEDEDRGQ